MSTTDRLHLSPRRSARVTTGEVYSASGGHKSSESLEDFDDFVDIGSLSEWDVSNRFVTPDVEY